MIPRINRRTGKDINCPCGKSFYAAAWEIKKEHKKYCSSTCRLEYRKRGWEWNDKQRNTLSVAQKALGKKLSDEQKRKISEFHKTRKHTVEERRQRSISMKGKNSKGGVTPINKLIRKSLDYKLWREAVFARDGYKCVFCGAHGYVEADHIKQFAFYPDLRFELSNGRTLCKPCHKETPTYLNNKNNYAST